MLPFTPAGGADDGLDGYANLTFCARHAIEFVDRLREVADQAHAIAVEATQDDAPMGTLA